MKNWKFGPMPLLGVTLGGGLLGLLFRLLMLTLGYDGPVQISGHWTYIVLWVLSLAVPGGLFVLSRGMGAESSMKANFPAAPVGGLCTAAAALLLLADTMFTLLGDEPMFTKLSAALGVGAAVALGVHGVLRLRGQGSCAAALAVTLYMCLRLIVGFRAWSIDPLLGDYVFRLLGSVAAAFGAYQLSGFPIEKGNRPLCLFWCSTAVFFAMMNLADGGRSNLLFFGAVILWMLPGGCKLDGPAKPRRVLGGGFEESEQ